MPNGSNKINTYNIHIEKLFHNLNIGELIDVPCALSGGHLHKMFSAETLSCKYAIKVINPKIAARPGVLQFYIDSEKASNIAGKNIKTISAIEINGNILQELNGQYYLVFPWCNGESIFGNTIMEHHCKTMGETLAKIHKTDFSSIILKDEYSTPESIHDWCFYLKKGEETGKPWVEIFRNNIDKIYKYNEMAAASKAVLNDNILISHGDMEPKNTLWINDTPFVIDWESIGYINPYHDLVQTAVYWAKDDDEKLDKNKFLAFIQGYKNISSIVNPEWQAALDQGWYLGWLNYSFKRSLWIECANEEENKIGTEHVFWTINYINQYSKDKEMLLEWLSKKEPS